MTDFLPLIAQCSTTADTTVDASQSPRLSDCHTGLISLSVDSFLFHESYFRAPISSVVSGV